MSGAPVIAWSHSRVTAFKTCPRRFFELSIAKNFVEDFGPEADWGKKVHKALERRLSLGVTLPADMMQYEPHALKVEELGRRLDAPILCEQQLAVDTKLKPCGWFGTDTWGRCITDVLMANMTTGNAIAIDWKTVKKKDDDKQLALQAAFVFRHYPTVNRVMSAFCWLAHDGDLSFLGFTRDRETTLWKQYLPTVRELTDAMVAGSWPENPSGLCAKYCPVTTCKHNGGFKK